MSTFIIASILMATFIKVGYNIYKRKKTKNCCGTGCAGCSGCH